MNSIVCGCGAEIVPIYVVGRSPEVLMRCGACFLEWRSHLGRPLPHGAKRRDRAIAEIVEHARSMIDFIAGRIGWR